jgi:hypothetical protein
MKSGNNCPDIIHPRIGAGGQQRIQQVLKTQLVHPKDKQCCHQVVD